MRAVVQRAYGPADQLRVEEVPKPTPANGQVLVRVMATAVHADIWHVVTGTPYVLVRSVTGITAPKASANIPGSDMAGVVEATGEGVDRFRIGDPVYGEVVGNFQWRFGKAWAEYVAVKADVLVPKPESVTHAQVASIATPFAISWTNMVIAGLDTGGFVQAAEDEAAKRSRAAPQAIPNDPVYNPKRRQRILVNGAAGSVGSLCVAIGKAFGHHVTGVEHTDKLDLVRAAGADRVLDYTVSDATDPATLPAPDDGADAGAAGTGAGAGSNSESRGYDIVIDVASVMPADAVVRVLAKPAGKYVMIGHDNYGRAPDVGPWIGSLSKMVPQMLRAWWTKDPHRVLLGDFKSPKPPAVTAAMAKLVADGKLAPVVDRSYPLEEAGEAMRYLMSGSWKGRVVLAPHARGASS